MPLTEIDDIGFADFRLAAERAIAQPETGPDRTQPSPNTVFSAQRMRIQQQASALQDQITRAESELSTLERNLQWADPAMRREIEMQANQRRDTIRRLQASRLQLDTEWDRLLDQPGSRQGQANDTAGDFLGIL
jgi:hypothetical protein